VASTRRRWIPIVIGIGILLVFVALGAVIVGVVWLRENLQVGETSEADARVAFDEVQKRFAAKPPLVTLKDGLPSVDRAAIENRPRTTLATMHVLAWDPEDSQMARMSIPFWLLRLKETPIQFGAYASGADELGIELRAGDIERYGPGIVIDATMPRGARALIWVE
jgi:hypothetical protein